MHCDRRKERRIMFEKKKQQSLKERLEKYRASMLENTQKFNDKLTYSNRSKKQN